MEAFGQGSIAIDLKSGEMDGSAYPTTVPFCLTTQCLSCDLHAYLWLRPRSNPSDCSNTSPRPFWRCAVGVVPCSDGKYNSSQGSQKILYHPYLETWEVAVDEVYDLLCRLWICSTRALWRATCRCDGRRTAAFTWRICLWWSVRPWMTWWQC